MGKRFIIFSTISALLLVGCGKKAPTSAAAIPVNDTGIAATTPTAPTAVTAPTTGLSDPTGASQLGSTDPGTADPTATGTTTTTTTVASKAPSASPTSNVVTSGSPTPSSTPTATPTSTPTPSPTATPTPAPTATPTPAPTATPTPAPTPTPTPTPNTAANTPVFVQDIGNGSLNSSHGIVASNGFIYVVDNARMGLLGHYAAVRKYAIADGSYTGTSFQSVGWDGLKHLPTTVTAVKLSQGNLIAADGTTSYTFSMDASLVLKVDGGFSEVTSVVDPKTGDTYKLNGGQVDRVHNGTVLVSFGVGTITAAESIACAEDGTIFVTEANKGLVHQFAAPRN